MEEFCANRSKESLAKLLNDLAGQKVEAPRWRFPWPLEACVETSRREFVSLSVLASHAAAGALGDAEDWEAAEECWRTVGVSEADYLYVPEGGLPFDRRIAETGYPFGAGASIFTEGSALRSVLGSLLKDWGACASRGYTRGARASHCQYARTGRGVWQIDSRVGAAGLC